MFASQHAGRDVTEVLGQSQGSLMYLVNQEVSG
jgi:hypothetical protein